MMKRIVENRLRAEPSEGDDSAEDRARQTWARTLEQVPTLFGRLVYLAGLRNENSGVYRHHGLAQGFGASVSERVILLSHEGVFAAWLNLDLRQQHADLEQYLAGIGEERASVLEMWGALAPYKALIPAGAGGAERMLYETDLEIILELLYVGAADSRQP